MLAEVAVKPNKFLAGRSGIYGIRNTENGKIYVGKTIDMYRRCQQYRYDIEHRRMGHINDYLGNAVDKYGISAFEMFPLEFCPITELSERELFWIEKLKSTDRRYGYNLRMDSSSGMKAHPETSDKIRKNLQRQWAEGVRSGHSEHMRNYWKCNPKRSSEQADVLRRVLTKWEYMVETPSGENLMCDYKQLNAFGLRNALTSFKRTGGNSVKCKGHTVTRMAIGGLNEGET